MLGFIAASIFFVVILHSFQALQGLEIKAVSNPPVFCGETAGFQLQVANPRLRPRYALVLTLQQSRVFDLQAGQVLILALPMTTMTRGWLQCPVVTVASDFPLGLFRAWSPLRFDSRVLVYPKPSPLLLPFPGSGSGDDPQQRDKQGPGDDFDGIKPYQTGDSIRHIHWKALAKGQGLHSRYYVAVGAGELWLDFALAQGAELEERLSLLCRWVIEAEQSGLRYGLLLPGVRIEPASGATHFHDCLQKLAEF